MKENIYITALQAGAENLFSGISYENLKEKLIASGYQIEGEFEEYFITWFFTNFHFHNVSRVVTRPGGHDFKPGDYGTALVKPAFLTGEAYINYLDYVELHEAQKNSLAAQHAANKAINIAILTLWISAGIGIASILIDIFFP